MRGTGRFRGQPATFLVAARADGATLWSVRTADGRVEAAWSDAAGAEELSWGTGIRYPLDLEDLERHLRVTRAITGIDRPAGGADLEMATAAGPLRLASDRAGAFVLTVAGQVDWEFSVDRAQRVSDWPALVDTITASTSPATAEWRPGVPAALEARRSAASGLLLIRVAVNGTGGWFILDSAATEMVLLPEFAGRIGATAAGTAAVASIAGVEQAAVLELGTVDVGPLRLLRNTAAVSQALAGLPATIGDTVDGVIGAHVFARAVVTLDLQAGTAAVAPSAPDNERWLPVRLMNLHAVIPAEYEGRSALFRIDTGAVPGVLFHAGAVRRHALLEGRETAIVPGVFGAHELRVGKVESLRVLGVRIDDQVDACFLSGGAGVITDDHTDGVIGIPVLRELGELIIDLPRRRMAVRPRA